MHPWLHFKTITRHKLLVMHYCFRAGMYKQGLLHDLSKYAPVEFLVGCKYYQGDRSPNNAEREDTGISKSWLHHKGRNKHHFEYWVDYAPGDEHIIIVTHILCKAFFRHALAGRKHTAKRECKQAGRQEQINF